MIRALRRLAALVLVLGAVAPAAQAFQKPGFPRLAGINIGAPFNYDDPRYQSALAREHLIILGMYPGLSPGGRPMDAVVRAIKSAHPGALVFFYVNANEVNYDPSGKHSVWDAYQSKLDAMHWWLYSDHGQSRRVPSIFGPGYFSINDSLFTPKDEHGDNAIEWITRFYVDNYYKPNPSVDGFFMDNTFWHPYVNGDWQRNGADESAADARAGQWLRQGYARYYDLAKRLMGPGKYQIGNVTDWGDPGSVLDEYQGMLHGGVMEGLIGKSWSPETYGGWRGMMDRYRRIMANVGEPRLAIFNQWGNPRDLQAMRYGLGSCLLGDAYYSFTSYGSGYSGVAWFDEFDAQLGAAGFQPDQPWQKGVWRRDFDNGIVLVNPRGNGRQTVQLEGPFRHLKGGQDPVVNNGQTVTRVTLNDRDGVILIRPVPLKRPQAPAPITIAGR